MSGLAAPIDPLQPAPGGRPLLAPITCTADASTDSGVQHHLVIHSDWRAEAPDHDLAAERVATSLDGWCSCLHAADTVVPMARTAFWLITNPLMPSTALDRRRTPEPRDIGSTHLFGTTPIASASRDQQRAQAERRLLDELLAAIGSAWCPWGDPRQVDGGRAGFDELWRAGIPPARVDRLARMFPRASWPLPVDAYLAAQFGTVDLDWLSNAVTYYPERNFVRWALRRGAHVSHPTADQIGRMYDLQLSADDTAAAIDANVAYESLSTLSTVPDTTARSVARWLTLCAQLGARPTTLHWALLADRGVFREAPPPWAKDALARKLRSLEQVAIPRAELVVMLVLCPDVDVIRDALQHGVLTALDARFIETLTRKAQP